MLSRSPAAIHRAARSTLQVRAMAAVTALNETKDGAFVRSAAGFRHQISQQPGAEFPAEAGRYHLYVSYACPWACRCLSALYMKVRSSSCHKPPAAASRSPRLPTCAPPPPPRRAWTTPSASPWCTPPGSAPAPTAPTTSTAAGPLSAPRTRR